MMIKSQKYLLWIQDELVQVSPDIMKLGLLFETGIDVTSVAERPTFVTFQHKLLQEYAGGYFICKRLEKSSDVQV